MLDWCAEAGAAAIPYGGGSSVVGGVEPRPRRLRRRGHHRPAPLGPRARGRPVSRRAHPGRRHGPGLEDQLREHGLTLRHFPQSFEYSTLGGWIATRAGGHFATLATHIDDFVESVRALTPRGVGEPPPAGLGRGAEPRPAADRLGGDLGVITEAWMRVQDGRASAPGRRAVRRFEMEGAHAVRALAQSGLYPANCRLLDPGEAALTARRRTAGRCSCSASSRPTTRSTPGCARARAVRDHGGEVRRASGARAAGEAEGAWRDAFLQAPYLRDTLIAARRHLRDLRDRDHLGPLRRVRRRTRERARVGRAAARGAHLPLHPRLPRRPAPYFTVLAPARRGGELEQWDEIKAAASEAIADAGGTITHHHAVGRDHRPWYDRQRPDPFAAALRAAKAALDPAGILNPGVLLDAAGPDAHAREQLASTRRHRVRRS